MKSIETKYHGPTNTRGSRIIARAEGGHSISIPYHHELNSDENHQLAAVTLMEKLGWKGKLVGGGNVKGNGYNFVFVS